MQRRPGVVSPTDAEARKHGSRPASMPHLADRGCDAANLPDHIADHCFADEVGCEGWPVLLIAGSGKQRLEQDQHGEAQVRGRLVVRTAVGDDHRHEALDRWGEREGGAECVSPRQAPRDMECKQPDRCRCRDLR